MYKYYIDHTQRNNNGVVSNWFRVRQKTDGYIYGEYKSINDAHKHVQRLLTMDQKAERLYA